MAKTLIGNIKGKNGRGIASIKKTGTTGSVDTYTITYTDSTTSTFTVNNSDSISLQRQIVPSAAVESSTTASQAYAAGDYVVVSGVLRKVKSAIAKGNAISDSNSTATTVTGELANSVSQAGQTVDGWRVLRLGEVMVATKAVAVSFTANMAYYDSLHFAEIAAKTLPSGVFATAPTVSASLAAASCLCWVSVASGTVPTALQTQKFRIVTGSRSAETATLLLTAVG